MTRRILVRWSCALAAVALLCAACGNDRRERKRPGPAAAPAPVAGLQAVPADAWAVVVLDLVRLREAVLVKRALTQMFQRDPGMRDRVEALLGACQLDPAADLERVMLALGPDPDRALMEVTGRFDEALLLKCLGEVVRADGGQLTASTQDGRTIGRIERGGSERPLWFTLGSERSVLTSTSRDWLLAAVGTGDKLEANPELAGLLGQVDRSAGVWGVGRVSPAVGEGLVKTTRDAISAPPRALYGELDLRDGIRAVLGVVLATEADAGQLVSMANQELPALALVAQRWRLGRLISRFQVDSAGPTVYVRLSMAADEVKDLLAQMDAAGDTAIDRGQPTQQNPGGPDPRAPRDPGASEPRAQED